jgi:hypothetical protein
MTSRNTKRERERDLYLAKGIYGYTQQEKDVSSGLSPPAESCPPPRALLDSRLFSHLKKKKEKKKFDF